MNCVHTVKVRAGCVTSFAYLGDNLLASGSYYKIIKIWNITTGECIQTLSRHTNCYIGCLVYLDNDIIASASGDKTIKIWNIATGECIQTLNGHTDYVHSLTYIDNNRLASTSGDNTIKIWDIPTKADSVAKAVDSKGS